MLFLDRESKEGIEICNELFYNGEQIKAVIFDMDGVILDTEKLYCRFWREAAEFFGYRMTEEMALGMRSLNPTKGRELLEEYYGMFVDYQTIRNKRMQLMEKYISEHGVEVKPGIYDLLEFLKANHIKCAVATSSPWERARYHLERARVLRSMEGVASAYRVKKGKPEPDVYLYAIERLGVRPEECLVLEDSPTGLTAACRAGCVPVMVPDLDRPSEGVKSNIYAVAESLSYVKDMFYFVDDEETEGVINIEIKEWS